jgi:hypothetical protein
MYDEYIKYNITMNISDSCLSPQLFNKSHEFFECYTFFLFSHQPVFAILQILIPIGVIIFNSLVLISMIIGSNRHVTCFDQILVGHCIVNGITGIVDIPFYHIFYQFGYWPFGSLTATLWSSYDNNINLNTSLHMTYACYAKLRSIQSPKGYKRENLLRKPYLIIMSIWLFSLIVWTSFSFGFGLSNYKLVVNFRPFFYVTIANFLLWFMPLAVIFILAIYIFVLILIKAKRCGNLLSNRNENKIITNGHFDVNFKILNGKFLFLFNFKRFNYSLIKKRYRLAAANRFLIIMGSYWLQW